MLGFLKDIQNLLRPDARIKQLAVIARENGLKLKAQRALEKDPISQFGFEIFDGRSGKRLRGILFIPIKGIKGSVRVYDFHYFGDLGTSTTTVFEFYNESFDFSRFSIKPKSSSFIKSFFDEEDPVIQTATPEFLENYAVQTEDAFKLKENLTEDFLDKYGDEPGWSIEGKDSALIYYKQKELIPSNRLMERVERFAHLMYDLENGKTFI
jgi:hypothetical protein